MEALPLRARPKKSACQIKVQPEGLVKLPVEVTVEFDLEPVIESWVSYANQNSNLTWNIKPTANWRMFTLPLAPSFSAHAFMV
jgi:hypothetical protein